jgi:myo-inositol catabolism protein IolC
VNPGHNGNLYILAFDHRASFQEKLFGISGVPTSEETKHIADAKLLVYEGLENAAASGEVAADHIGVLVDEQFGSPVDIPARAKASGFKLAMPVEKSGQGEFDFEYGDAFGAHIEGFEPDFSKVLVRYNPAGDRASGERQLERLRRLSDWLLAHNRKLMFELLVPATDGQLAQVRGDRERFDAELRPELMCRSIEAIQNAGVEVDVWKIEGVDHHEDARMIARQTRARGRSGVVCVLLGRGAGHERVDAWLQHAAPVDGFAGFAIGRSIWWDALKGYLDGSLEREEAAQQIADSYLRFIRVYESTGRTAVPA